MDILHSVLHGVDFLHSQRNRHCGNHSWLACSHVEPAIHSKERFLFNALTRALSVSWPWTRTITRTITERQPKIQFSETSFKMNVMSGHSTKNVAVMRRCERHIEVQEQSACEMLSTFVWAAAKKCKTKLFVRCFPEFGRSTKEQMSVRCARPMSTQQP